MARAADKLRYPIRLRLALAAAACALAVGLGVAAEAPAGPTAVKTVYAKGKLVPIPASIPHEAGDMVDRRILPDLRWIEARFPIFITDGYSGPRPGGGKYVGCDCHTDGSDHHYGLAVDIVPVNGTTRCDRIWKPITRLALWAEPRQDRPVPPFRWVGYDGDVAHGCGHHLHLSWNHAEGPEFRVAAWVSVFTSGTVTPPPPKLPPPPSQPSPAQTKPPGPSGGISGGAAKLPRLRGGGIAAGGPEG